MRGRIFCSIGRGGQAASVPIDAFERSERWLVGVLTIQGDIPDNTGYTGILTAGLQEYGRYRLIEQERKTQVQTDMNGETISLIVNFRTNTHDRAQAITEIDTRIHRCADTR